MRRWIVAIAATLVALAGIAFAYIERVDDGFIVFTRARIVDPVGEIKIALTRATRDCTLVQRLDTATIVAALQMSNLTQPPGVERPKPRFGRKQGDWLLLETEFENLEPAIVLLKQRSGGFEVGAVYSGTAAPFNDVQFIHEYLLQHRPDVPRELVNCYEPAGAPFDREN